MLYEKTDFKKIGQNIKKERELQKLSQEKLAAKADVTTETLRSIENGPKRSVLETITKVTDALCVSLKQML